MCVAVPTTLKERVDNVGIVDFMGNRARVDLTLVPNAVSGDKLLVHAGCAIEIMRGEDADALESLLGELMNE